MIYFENHDYSLTRCFITSIISTTVLASGNSNSNSSSSSSSSSSSQDNAYAEHGVSQAWETIREGTELMAMECIWCIQHSDQVNCLSSDDDGGDGLMMKVIELFITMTLNSLHQGLLHEVHNYLLLLITRWNLN